MGVRSQFAFYKIQPPSTETQICPNEYRSACVTKIQDSHAPSALS